MDQRRPQRWVDHLLEEGQGQASTMHGAAVHCRPKTNRAGTMLHGAPSNALPSLPAPQGHGECSSSDRARKVGRCSSSEARCGGGRSGIGEINQEANTCRETAASGASPATCQRSQCSGHPSLSRHACADRSSSEGIPELVDECSDSEDLCGRSSPPHHLRLFQRRIRRVVQTATQYMGRRGSVCRSPTKYSARWWS